LRGRGADLGYNCDHTQRLVPERGTEMRKFIVGAIVLFVVYFLVTNPEGAANLVQGIWDAVVSFFDSVLNFISALFS